MKKSIEQYMKTNIKEIIAEYPLIGSILQDAGIGCSSCSMGTCPLGEIVNVHGLTVEQEKGLLTNIAAILYPGEQVEIPLTIRENTVKKGTCPPIRKMMDEHALILRFLVCVPEIIKLTISDGIQKEMTLNCVKFIKEFADGYHHAKEEEILFTYFKRSNEIIESFLKEHEAGRGFVRNILDGIDRNDRDLVTENLNSYAVLLREHINKEDTILFPWMNRELTDAEVGALFAKCTKIDIQYALNAKMLEEFVVKTEAQLKTNG